LKESDGVKLRRLASRRRLSFSKKLLAIAGLPYYAMDEVNFWKRALTTLAGDYTIFQAK
jgi:hypothetical protein